MDLKSLLLSSNDEKDPNFKLAHQTLINCKENEPNVLMTSLMEIINDDDLNYQQIFLAITLIIHCFLKMEIPISFDHPFVEIELDQKIIDDLILISFNFFQYPQIPVQNQAVQLCNTIIFTQIRNPEFMESYIQQILDFIRNNSNSNTIETAIKCIIALTSYKNEQFFLEHVGEFIAFSIEKIESTENVVLLSNLLIFLSNIIPQFIEIYPEDQLPVFIDMLFLKNSDKDSINGFYSFFTGILNFDSSIIFSRIDQMLDHIATDLNQNLCPEAMLVISDFIQNIAQYQEISHYIAAFAETAVPILIQEMHAIPPDSTISLYEYGPHIAAECALAAIVKANPDDLCSAVFEIASSTIDDESSPTSREVAWKLLNIVITSVTPEAAEELHQNILEKFAEATSDESQRVQFASLCLLIDYEKILKDRHSAVELAPIVVYIAALIAQNNEVSLFAARSLAILASFEDAFTTIDFNDALATIAGEVHSQLEGEVLAAVQPRPDQEVDQDSIRQFLQIGYERLLDSELDTSLFDLYFTSLGKYVTRAGEWIVEEAPVFCALCVAALQAREDGAPFYLMASLQAKVDIGESFRAPFLEAIQSPNPDIFVPAMDVITPELLAQLPAEEAATAIQSAVTGISGASGARAKAAAVDACARVLPSRPEMIEYGADLFFSLNFISKNVMEILRQYSARGDRLLCAASRLLMATLITFPDEQVGPFLGVSLMLIEASYAFVSYNEDVLKAIINLYSECAKRFPQETAVATRTRRTLNKFVNAIALKAAGLATDE